MPAEESNTISGRPAPRDGVQDRPAACQRRRWPGHAAAIGVMFVIALSFHIVRTSPPGAADALEGDAGNIASFAAGQDHPELFGDDALLGDTRNSGWYKTVHVRMLRAFGPAAGGYGAALLWTYGAHVLLHLVGFYLLGVALFSSRFWAAVLALITLAYVPLGIAYTGWGLFADPIPRFAFAALVGFLWAAAVRWREQPRAWPWIMMAAGLLVYVHPVGAAPVGVATWLGLWSFNPRAWSLKRRCAYMALLGLLFVVPAMPFAVSYMSGHEHGATVEYEKIFNVMYFRFGLDTMDIPYALRQVFKTFLAHLILPLGLAGLAVLWLLGRGRCGAVGMFALWLVGFVLIGGVAPLIDHELARARGVIPAEIDLRRGLRFVIPLMLTLPVWALASLHQHHRRWGRPAALLGLAAICGWFVWHGGGDILAKPYRAVQALRGKTPPSDVTLKAEAIAALRQFTPARARILPMGYSPSPIRHAAFRQVVHAYKDGGCLSLANHRAALIWHDRQLRCRELRKAPPGRRKLEAIADWARQLGAEYVLLDDPHVTVEQCPAAVERIWGNQGYCLLGLVSSGEAGHNQTLTLGDGR